MRECTRPPTLRVREVLEVLGVCARCLLRRGLGGAHAAVDVGGLGVRLRRLVLELAGDVGEHDEAPEEVLHRVAAQQGLTYPLDILSAQLENLSAE